MGLKPRLKVARLPQKLKQIREHLKMSQTEMLRHLGYESIFDRSTISHYESGEREPPLPVLLSYARAAGIHVDDLIDDQCDLNFSIKSKL
ncbi:MAG: helix-turn-helix domain-containing protein [Acidobacteriota bacterium]|nr:helix-turn-helix domain-containing protein [Acidobacteriota bacterium]